MYAITCHLLCYFPCKPRYQIKHVLLNITRIYMKLHTSEQARNHCWQKKKSFASRSHFGRFLWSDKSYSNTNLKLMQGYACFLEFLQNYSERQILWNLPLVVFHALILKLPIQTSLSVAPKLQDSFSFRWKLWKFQDNKHTWDTLSANLHTLGTSFIKI